MSPNSGQRVPGHRAGAFSIRPLTEAQSLLRGYMDYAAQKKAEAGGAPVFRIDAGFPAVAITDYAAARFYFQAPTSVLRREEKRRLGPGQARPEMIGSAHPTVLSTGARHASARAFTDAILALRADALLPTLGRVLDEHIDRWSSLDTFDLYGELNRFYGAFAFAWLFDCQPEPELYRTWGDNAFTIGLDAAVAKMVSAAMVPRCPRAAIAATKQMCAVIEASPLYPTYVSLAEEHGVPVKDLPQFLNFLAMVNACGAPLLTTYPSMPRFAVDAPLRDTLAAALAEATTPEQLLADPWLDCVFHEVMRHYAQPRVFYKEAVTDFSLPTGQGASYQVKKGERVMVFITHVNRDPLVFSEPEAFDPARFSRAPVLKEKVILYGTLPGADNPYGCAAAPTGQAETVWKIVNATLVRDCVWETLQAPDISVNHYNLVSPTDLQITGFRRRSDAPAADRDDALDREFRLATQAVWSLDVSFPRDEYFRIYGLYKQALQGDVQGEAPSRMQAKLRLKWDAWSSVRGLSRDDARREYTALVRAKKPLLFAVPEEDASPQASAAPDQLSRVDGHPAPAEDADTLRVTIQTGAPPRVDIHVSLRLRGASGTVETPWYRIPGKADTPTLAGVLPWHIRKKHRAHFTIEHPVIGRRHVVEVRVAAPGGAQPSDYWMLDEIILTDSIAEVSQTFPCWEAVSIPCERHVLFDGTGGLPQAASALEADARSTELAAQQATYRWAHADAHEIPGFADFDDHASFPTAERFYEKQNLGEMSTLFSDQDTVAEHFDHVEEYGALLDRWDGRPWVAHEDRWRDDAELGRNFLQGSHCTFIRRARTLPDAFNGTADLRVTACGEPLAALMDRGQLFVADYGLLDGLENQAGVVLRAPIALLWSDPAQQTLQPVAIQIDRDPDAVVFTPDDSALDWLIAKLWVRMADTSTQQIGSHFFMTHALIEAVSVATRRQLSAAHPVFKLLVPHMQNTIGITALARKYLLCEGGLVDRYMGTGGGSQYTLLQRVYKTVSMKRAIHLPTDLADRGVADQEGLPSYPYRDDGLLFWAALERYAGTVLGIYYANDDAVRGDFELQAWIREIRDEGFPDSDLPRQLSGTADLHQFVTSLLFTAIVTHATMNYQQYETYAFIPNSPGSLQADPPRARGEATEALLMESLPSKQIARGIVTTVVALSRRWDEDVPLGKDPRRLFSHPSARLADAEFRRALGQIEATITERNASRAVPSTVLQPSRMTHGLCL